MPKGSVTVRALSTLAEFDEAVAVQRAVWGFSDLDVVPLHVLLTAAKNGGVVLGAYDDEVMVGMLFGFPGLTPRGSLKHCSHVAGVLAEARRRSVGATLKWAQRDLVLAQGVELVTWTFDPLEARNASLNLHHLGATSSSYLENMYGELRDDLNQGLPTDRVLVEWQLASDHVCSRHLSATHAPRTAGAPAIDRAPPQENVPEMIDTTLSDGIRVPTGWREPSAPRVLLEVPPSFQTVKSRDAGAAQAWRQIVREAMGRAFALGYVATDFVTGTRGDDRSFYVLCAPPS